MPFHISSDEVTKGLLHRDRREKGHQELEQNSLTDISAFQAAEDEWWRVHIANELAFRRILCDSVPAMSVLDKGPDSPSSRPSGPTALPTSTPSQVDQTILRR
jgi:hypothetical protein